MNQTMFKDFTKLSNTVDLRSVIILIRKIQSFYINARTEFYKEELEAKIKNPDRIKEIKNDIEVYWKNNMFDIFNGLEKSGYKIELDGSKINVSEKL